MKRRCMAFVLTLALVLTILPMTAMAAGTDVAKIGSVGYPSIQAAVSAADDGDTIVIVKDHAVDTSAPASQLASTIYSLIDVERKITIDWNGKKVTANTGNKDIIFINVQNGGDLTLIDSVGGASLSVTSEVDTYALLCCFDDASSLTVNGGSYRLNRGGNGRGMLYADSDLTFVINGGTFVLDNVGTKDNGSPWLINASGKDDQRIRVNGGSFNSDIMNQYWKFEAEVDPEKIVAKSGNMWTLVDAAAYTTEILWHHNWDRYHVGYSTFEEGLAAAKAEGQDFISLTTLKDVTLSDTLKVDFDLTLNLNGQSVIWNGGEDKPVITVTDDAKLEIDDFVPERAGYVFSGWYTDAALETPFNLENGVVPAGTSLYASWDVAPVSGGDIPETGDGMGLFVFAGLALISMLGMVVLKKREQF